MAGRFTFESVTQGLHMLLLLGLSPHGNIAVSALSFLPHAALGGNFKFQIRNFKLQIVCKPQNTL